MIRITELLTFYSNLVLTNDISEKAGCLVIKVTPKFIATHLIVIKQNSANSCNQNKFNFCSEFCSKSASQSGMSKKNSSRPSCRTRVKFEIQINESL